MNFLFKTKIPKRFREVGRLAWTTMRRIPYDLEEAGYGVT